MPTDFHIKTFEEESLTGKDDVEMVAEKLLTQLYQIFHLFAFNLVVVKVYFGLNR